MPTTDRLPISDLVSIAPLATRDERLFELRRVRLTRGNIKYNYYLTRSRTGAVLDVRSELFGDFEKPLSWSDIKESVIASTNKPEEANANLRVLEPFYDYARQHGAQGRRLHILPFNDLVFWFPAVVSIDGIKRLVFVDPRVSPRVTPLGRKFIFSVMHDRLQVVLDSDDVKLGIFQFPLIHSRGSARTVEFFTHDREGDLFDYKALHNMIAETLELWRIVLEERQKKQSGTE